MENEKTYDVVCGSLQGLIYLADNDPHQLARIVDNLDESAGSPPRLSSSPSSGERSPDETYILDPQSRAARLKRTGKLSNFFGEAVDLSQSPLTPPRSSTATAKRKSRRETIDGMLGEMWRAVQADVSQGSIRVDELDRLGDMMSAFRRRGEKGGWEEL